MDGAVTFVVCALALSIPITAGVVAWHLKEIARLMFRHMEETQVIGGEPVRLRGEVIERRFELEQKEAEHRRQVMDERRRQTKPTLERVTGG